VIAPQGARSDTLDVLHGSHPIPNESSMAAARAVEALLTDTRQGDAVLVLISGGASALIAAPAPGITIEEYAHCVRRLLRAGADINALNIVRQYIDRLKGGRMATLAAPAQVLGLVLSDVVGDPLDIIASGPLTQSSASPEYAAETLRAHGLPALPLLYDSPATGNARVRVIGSNSIAIAGAAAHAAQLGYATQTVPEPIVGEARIAGEHFARNALERRGERPLCILAGGETTVTVTGTGVGGRNQEFVLAAALELNGAADITIASVGTDGVDGPTSAAGAVADGTIDTAAATEALRDNDSWTFFHEHGGHIVTGPTGTNVMDVQLALIG
jgi:glycerate-2-kinase